LAAAIEAKGFDVWVRPAITIESLDAPQPTGSFDVAIFLSEHAVRFASAKGWPGGKSGGKSGVREAGATIIAIGPATQRALGEVGVSAAVPNEATSEGIVALLRHLGDRGDLRAPGDLKSVLIVAGVGGRDHLQRYFRDLQVPVIEWSLYRRNQDTQQLPAAIRIDAIVASSGDGLRVVGKVWFAARRDGNVPVVVPSARVAGAAQRAGFRTIAESGAADTEAVVTALQGIFG
jgi:uroporphyrinogen-III synthase